MGVTGMGICIAVFGAFDVNSFGDMLFPLALENELRKRIEIDEVILFSPTKSRSEYGYGKEIYSYEEFDDINQNYGFKAIVIGGGELLHNKAIEFTDLSGKKIIYHDGEVWKTPVSLGKKYKIKVLINSVGMPYELSDNDKKILEGISYLSFRDRYSVGKFCGKKMPKQMALVPDSLWNLDEYFPGTEDSQKRLRDKYIALQIGTLDGCEQIYETVLQYATEKKIEVVAFAINWCHADREVVKKIKDRQDENCFVLDRILSPGEIIEIISSAHLYVGTSFHGALTACLYETPVLMYNIYSYFVSKMDGLADWGNMQFQLVENIRQLRCALADTTKAIYKPDLSGIKIKLSQHFDEMAKIINAEETEKIVQLDVCKRNVAYERSYFEWKDEEGRDCCKTIIVQSDSSEYVINEPVVGKKDLYWNVPLMEFALILVDSVELIPVNVDDKGICFDRIARFKVQSGCEQLRFSYRKQLDKQSETFEQLLIRYRNKAAHVELLEEAERRYQRNISGLSTQTEYLEIIKKDLTEEKRQLEKKNDNLRKEIEQLKQENRNKEGHIEQLKQENRNKEGHIELLLEVEREYEREKRSRTYKMALVFRKISVFLMPVNSKRRFFAKMFVKAIKNPKLMFHMINVRRIKNFFSIVRKEGMDGINYHYKLVEDYENSKMNPFHANQFEISQVREGKKIEEYERISFLRVEQPDVSIVIPVYNQFEYTYNCLASIFKNSGEVRYEVIIADDCSVDLTKDLEQVVEGITVIHNEKNLRFLLNCNHAAEKVRGKYIVFLNNDTQVQVNWLQPLVDILDKDTKVGLTGSKLVYSDGHLQEAGGIFWNDASAWNYGNRKNPDDPEFNYVKEADYISGAAIMIRTSLWKEIGGFDERFAPAYYEDSDLAFEVRKHGYKVVYQPLSVVVHFEGISNGTDLNSGQKAYQVKNQAKFFEKWKDVLEKEHFPNGENVFLAKDRSRFKKQILVVDHYVPHYDRDAGGKCTYMYLLLFVKMGFKVTFIGDNFFKHEPYTTDLNQHGIEVLYGNYYFENWKDWLKENLHYFDYVYLQRPHISIKYIDLVKEYSHAKILYFAHDLHHVREYREYQLTGDEEKRKSSEHWKKIEYELFEKADVGHVVGTYEQGVMQEAFPEKPIRNIPLYIYDDVLTDINKNFQERKDLIYVGGFGHPPNVDAVLWFGREVFPKILKKYPAMKWHVVGGKVPLEVQEMASENLIIEGFLSDEDLHELYRTCRVAVVPLRVGAGVKGKVVEAAYYQIPLVTTTIGAEGLSREEGNMVVEDDADQMAGLICGMYEDYALLRKMSDAGITFIQKYFTEEEAERVLMLDLNK